MGQSKGFPYVDFYRSDIVTQRAGHAAAPTNKIGVHTKKHSPPGSREG